MRIQQSLIDCVQRSGNNLKFSTLAPVQANHHISQVISFITDGLIKDKVVAMRQTSPMVARLLSCAYLIGRPLDLPLRVFTIACSIILAPVISIACSTFHTISRLASLNACDILSLPFVVIGGAISSTGLALITSPYFLVAALVHSFVMPVIEVGLAAWDPKKLCDFYFYVNETTYECDGPISISKQIERHVVPLCFGTAKSPLEAEYRHHFSLSRLMRLNLPLRSNDEDLLNAAIRNKGITITETPGGNYFGDRWISRHLDFEVFNMTLNEKMKVRMDLPDGNLNTELKCTVLRNGKWTFYKRVRCYESKAPLWDLFNQNHALMKYTDSDGTEEKWCMGLPKEDFSIVLTNKHIFEDTQFSFE